MTLKTDWKSVSGLTIKNTDGLLQKVKPGLDPWFGTLEYDSKKYKFKQFHFHQPSEHTISGLRFDMEMHMVHQVSTNTDDYVVLGYLFNIGGSDNEWLKSLKYNTPSATTNGEVKITDTIDPWDMVSKMNDMEAFTYEGSFTTPPCTEGVHWFVFREWNYLSKAQWDALKASVPLVAMVYGTGNGQYRPVQALNSRTVTLRTIHLDNGGYLGAGTIAGIVIACVIGIAILIGVPATVWWCKRSIKRNQDARDIAEHIDREAENQEKQPYKQVDKA